MRRAAASLPLAVVLLDVTAIAVLLPDIRLDLGASSSGGQWVLNAYLLAIAALLPLAAALAGRASARALAAAGALAMAAGAVICVRADSTAVLVAGRAVQGAGAAALLACAAAPMLDGARRDRLATAALPALALALGPLVGGAFAEQNWWRLFFWAGVPLAVGAAAAALAAPRAERRPAAPPSGARPLAFAAGLVAIALALVQGEPWPWGWSALLLLAGAGLLRRAAPDLRGGLLAWAALAACLTTLLFLMPEYFQLVRNLSGLRSGTLLLAATLPAVVTWVVSPRLAQRVAAGSLGIAGAACAVIGLGALATIHADTPYAVLIGVLAISGTGLGLAAGAAHRLPQGEWPIGALASALAGAAVGLAGAGGAFQFAQVDERDSGASFEHAQSVGVGWAALFLVFVLAATALLVWRTRRPAPAPG